MRSNNYSMCHWQKIKSLLTFIVVLWLISDTFWLHSFLAAQVSVIVTALFFYRSKDPALNYQNIIYNKTFCSNSLVVCVVLLTNYKNDKSCAKENINIRSRHTPTIPTTTRKTLYIAVTHIFCSHIENIIRI